MELSKEVKEIRKSFYGIQPMFLNRWSPRAFSKEPVEREEILAVLEAAGWAPSCFNDQPWRFVIADNKEKLNKFYQFVYEQNLEWAKNAPVLIALLSKKTFSNGKDNRWHSFDSGTAWGYLALEALHRGLITHAMGGFSRKKAKEVLDLGEEYDVHAVIALGKKGSIDGLPEEIKERELPSKRKDLNDNIIEI